MCLVQNFQNGPILTKSTTYSSWFFLKNEPFLTRQNEIIVVKVLQRATEYMF